MVKLDDINFEYIQNIINMLQNVRSIEHKKTFNYLSITISRKIL